MMTLPGIQILAEVIAERAVNSIFGGLLVAALAWVVLQVVGKQNSRTRFAVWFSALIAIAGLPFVSGLRTPGIVSQATHAEFTLPGFWAIAILAVWILFAGLAATRVLIGLWNLRRLRRGSVPIGSSELDPALREVLSQCQAVRPVTVCTSSRVSVPTAIGFFKPAILIPEWALRDLPVEELKIILLHEFAHLRRWDDWTNLAQKIVRSVFFFHPAVWWIEKRLSLEREMACDDAVLVETNNPRAYAECLVSLAEKSFVQRGLAMAQAAISRACETSARLAQILDADRPRATRLFKPALGLMTAVAAACLVLLPDAPKFVAFENSASRNNVQSLSAAKDTFPREAQSLVVPASLPTGMESAGNNGVRKVTSTHAVHPAQAVYRPSKRARVGFAKVNFNEAAGVTQKHYQHPVVFVPAALTELPAESFLVTVQTAEFNDQGSNDQGSVVLSVSVWRVTFVSPRGNATQQGVAAKSI